MSVFYFLYIHSKLLYCCLFCIIFSNHFPRSLKQYLKPFLGCICLFLFIVLLKPRNSCFTELGLCFPPSLVPSFLLSSYWTLDLTCRKPTDTWELTQTLIPASLLWLSGTLLRTSGTATGAQGHKMAVMLACSVSAHSASAQYQPQQETAWTFSFHVIFCFFC